ncbi:regulatory protein RecX [uncultured Microbacterium sp.]|uniref:regulatory protein RecX n=1 Tax=uncultured Microbacterium sp. TaxID=191216 RepID=UPI0028DBB251|nr:regulatory protein RecX [uncultured Microbacterium sp.]
MTMDDISGGDARGESERIAPVIPLFGRSGSDASRGSSGTGGPSSAAESSSGDDAPWASTWHPSSGQRPDRAEEQVRDPASRARLDAMGSPSPRHPARSAAPTQRAAEVLRALPSSAEEDGDEAAADLEQVRATAEEALLRKLRARSLSVSEARQVLRSHELPSSEVDDLLDDFLRRRYLDDEELARSLVTSGVERRNQGRVVLARELAKRGIARDVVEAALSEVPDDDEERALEFARSKARSMSRLDPDTALRRLMGQLARRGYGGSAAMSAAKTALREVSSPARPSGVRFVDSD